MGRIISLRVKLTLTIAVLLTGLAGVTLMLLQRLMTSSADVAAQRRGVAVARVLASALRPALDFEDPADARRLLELTAGPDLVYGEVRKADSTLLTAYVPGAKAQADGTAERVGAPLELAMTEGSDTAWSMEGEQLHVLARVEIPAVDEAPARVLGTLRMDFSLSLQRRERDESFRLAAWAALLVVLLGVALGLILGSYLVAPILELARVTRAIAETGDLRLPIDVRSNDETGVLAQSFRQMVDGQRALLGALRSSVSGLLEVLDAVERASSTVSRGAGDIEAELAATTDTVRGMLASIQGVGSNVVELRGSTQRGNQALNGLVTQSDEVARSAAEMARFVAGSAEAVDQVAGAVTRVAGSIEELERALSTTTQAMDEIRRAIDAVQRNARDTAALSAQSASESEEGARSLADAIDSMDRLSKTAAEAFVVLAQLGQSVASIHGIVELINDLAHKTNLLALNAGIIAAHAGEHGAAFNVVAQEIKQLADRTRSSTAEITTVIARVRDESERAGAAMQAGMSSVDEGSRVGKAAGAALGAIRNSSQRGRAMVEAIATDTDKEAGHTRTVAEAFTRIGKNLQQITVAAQEQARESQKLRNTTRDIRDLTEQVRRASDNQVKSCRDALGAMGAIDSLAVRVDQAQTQQTAAAETALRAVEAIRNVSRQQSDGAGRLQSVVDALRRQAEEIQSFMRRYQA
ncbi:MAG: HAMP domain-containing protein [Deltaproteobacteria bacterium]|nr:HAMP domain-containing protein [Deltaproteobacteria bacterium]